MNSELCRQALIKIGNPNVLVNLISKRVRQLNSSGKISRPLILDATGLGAADIALQEIVDDKMSFDMPVSKEILADAPAPRKRRKSGG